MGQDTRKQSYPYTLRTITVTNESVCSDRVMLYITPPDNAITIEALYTHFVFQFDSAIASGNRILESLGIANEYSSNPTRIKRQTINQTADGNRRVDYFVDLTPYLKNDDVTFSEEGNIADLTDFTLVEAKFPAALVLEPTTGTIDLWKIDALFTTTGIR